MEIILFYGDLSLLCIVSANSIILVVQLGSMDEIHTSLLLTFWTPQRLTSTDGWVNLGGAFLGVVKSLFHLIYNLIQRIFN
jgi:hypothetical protein